MNKLTSSCKCICTGAKTSVLLHPSEKFIIPHLPSFEKLDLSQFRLYIETETMTQCFVCCNFQKNILVRSTGGKENVICILHMLRIHTGLRKLIKTNVYDLHLKINPFHIGKPCIKIAKREVLFEQYRMALNR